MLPPRSNSSTSTTAFTSSGHLRQPTPVFSPRGEAPACNQQQQSPSPTNTDASSPGRSTSSTSATASPSSSHHRQPTLMLPPGEAPARRAPLHPAAAVTIANQRRCFIPEGKHQLDEYHCITRQYSPSPTNIDASSPRRSTRSASPTASPSSSHHRRDAGCQQQLFDGFITHTLTINIQGQGVVCQALLHRRLVFEPLLEPLPRLARLVIAFRALEKGDDQNQCGTSAFSLVRCFTKEMVPHLEYEMLRSLVDLAH